MDTMMYETLLNSTKTALCSDVQKELNNSNFHPFFTNLLEDCNICITQSLESAVELLRESNLNTKTLIEYIEDTICLLRLMSNYIKNVMEAVSMSCCTMRSFPTTTGNILVMVFKHCKDSEIIYGGHLAKVGRQLKDLFRTCHELQITYLMILEKHFLFDLTDEIEQDVLINALQINMEIGEIVQGLDVKTLAEQWKAYTMICEKYSTYLMDKIVFNNCTKILCSMIDKNIANSLEVGLDEKVVVRSLKVTSFIIKILLKVTTTFRNASNKKYNDVLETLINIYLNNEAYLEVEGRSPQTVNLIKANVLVPTDLLLSELLQSEQFTNSLFQYDVFSIRKGDKLLGYIVLLISLTKLMLQVETKLKVPPQKVIKSIFQCVPYCCIWFNMPLKFDGEAINSEATYGLYEYLLTHTAAVSLLLSSDEVSSLEKLLFESLLTTDCWKGLFASNLWVLVARMNPQHFVYFQLVSLCRTYQRLESHHLFANSPQKTYITATITRLFELLDMDNKIQVLKQFSPIYDETNIGLWAALKLNNIAWDVKSRLEEEVIEKCKMATTQFCVSNVKSPEINSLIKLINLLGTFSITAGKIDDHATKLWMMVCLKNNNTISKGDLAKSTAWFLEYIQAIGELTSSMKNTLFTNPMNLIKVLHVISTVIQNGNTEIKLYLIDPLCKYATFYKNENKNVVELSVSESFLALFQSEGLVKATLFNKLRKYQRDTKMDRIITLAMNKDNLFRNSWNRYLERSKLQHYKMSDIKSLLESTIDNNYNHKCLENDSELNFKKDNNIELNTFNIVQLETKTSDNFDFVSVDDIFNNDSDSEPMSKKMKLTNEASDIVCRLENDTMLLYKMKENIFDTETKQRIKNVCEKLRNIVE